MAGATISAKACFQHRSPLHRLLRSAIDIGSACELAVTWCPANPVIREPRSSKPKSDLDPGPRIKGSWARTVPVPLSEIDALL